MVYDLEDKRNIIFLRNQLINADILNLKELYSDKDGYAYFLDTLNIALADEPAFFLIDDSILSKAEDILQSKRFDYRCPEYYTVINEIIIRINNLRGKPEPIKKMLRKQYIMWQQQIRQTSFSNNQDFLNGLAYDAQLLEKLNQQDLGETDAVYFFASTNYLAKVLPEVYQEDETRIDLTMERLDEHAKKRWIWNYPKRAFAKDAIKNIQKIKRKEE